MTGLPRTLHVLAMTTTIGALFVMACTFGSHSQSDERLYSYLYPIDTITIEGRDVMLTLWQKSHDSIELYACDSITGAATKELFSLFSPAGVQVLPGKHAYSFIDNGMVRIKECVKRSPATIVFDKPLFNISLINWINDTTAYCHAQEGRRFGLYMFNRDGRAQRLLYNPSCDYLFPSRVGNKLFYICRVNKNNKDYHAISAVPFDDNVPYDDTVFYAHEEPILQAGTLSIAFLRMHSPDQGFVIAYANAIDANAQPILFHYYLIEKKECGWRAQQLFSFAVPSFLLDTGGENRLYDNMIPLLPYHDGTNIYYGSSQMCSSSMQIYCFNMMSKRTKRCAVVGNRNQLLFCPRRSNGLFVCGGSLVPDAHDCVPAIIYSKDEDVKCNLVHLR